MAGCRAEPGLAPPRASLGPTRRPSSLSRSREEPCRTSPAPRGPSPEQSSCSLSSSAWWQPRRCSSHRPLRPPRPRRRSATRSCRPPARQCCGRVPAASPGTSTTAPAASSSPQTAPCPRPRWPRSRRAPAPRPADQPRLRRLPAPARSRWRDLRRPVPLLARLQRRQGRHLLLPHRGALREGRQDLVHRPGTPHPDRPHHRLQLPQERLRPGAVHQHLAVAPGRLHRGQRRRRRAGHPDRLDVRHPLRHRDRPRTSPSATRAAARSPA